MSYVDKIKKCGEDVTLLLEFAQVGQFAEVDGQRANPVE